MTDYVLTEEIPKISEYDVFIAPIVEGQTMPNWRDVSAWTEIQGLETAAIENEGNDITVYYLGRKGGRTVYNVELNPSLVVTGVRTKNDPGQKLLHATDRVFAIGNARKWWTMARFDEDVVYGVATVSPYGFGGGAANEIPRVNWTFNFDGIPAHVKRDTFDFAISYFGLQEDDLNPNPIGFNKGDIPFTLQDVTRDSATFDGWYDAETGGNKITVIASEGDKVLYARFS